jgi:MOSC domain-containing protein YiiM
MSLLPADSNLGRLMARFPRAGQVQWLGVRPKRDVPMEVLDEVEAVTGQGLVGDRYSNTSGTRGITLIQAEHLPVIASLSGHAVIEPARLRRNAVVAGISLVALKGRRFRIGDVELEGMSTCDPCSRMEDELGPGGFNAMRGMGGLCARIVEGGLIRRGDAVVALVDESATVEVSHESK